MKLFFCQRRSLQIVAVTLYAICILSSLFAVSAALFCLTDHERAHRRRLFLFHFLLYLLLPCDYYAWCRISLLNKYPLVRMRDIC